MASVSRALAPKPSVEAIATGIAADGRARTAEALQDILGASYRLLVKTQIHHWNVVGPLFHPIHVLTEAHYEDMFAAIDTIAERIRALGHPTAAPVIGTERAKVTTMSAKELVEDLVADHEALCRSMRDTAAEAEEVDDIVTNDLLVARLTFHEKAIWMLRAVVAD